MGLYEPLSYVLVLPPGSDSGTNAQECPLVFDIGPNAQGCPLVLDICTNARGCP